MRAPQYQVISTLYFAEPGCQGEPLLGSGSEGEYFEGNASLGMPGFFQTVGPIVTRFESAMSQPLGHTEVRCGNPPQGEGWLRAFAPAERPHVPVVEIR